MPGNVTLKAKGLQLSDNQLSLPEGSLYTAENVLIRRNDVIEPVRGFKVYGESFGTVTDRAKQLLTYKNRVLRHFSSTIEYDTGEDIAEVRQFDAFNETISEVDPGLRIKGIEANGNLYVTTSSGIKKISATNASEFTTTSGYVTKAGGLKALDLNGYLQSSPGNISGFLPQDSKVAYRILWNIKDVNNYVVQGTPSERFEITNSMASLMYSDFDRTLNALDVVSQQTGSKFNDNNYVSTLLLGANSTASSLHTNLIALAEKLDQEQGDLFVTADLTPVPTITTGVCTVNIAANKAIYGKLSVGDKVFLSGFTPGTSGTLNGVQTVSAITATTFTFSTTAVGVVTLSGTASVQSGWFRSITVPAEPSILPTNDELVAIQTYFDAILAELQSSHNVKVVADNDGVAAVDPFEILSVSIAGTTVTVTRDTSGDPRDNLAVGDYVNLSGLWTDSASLSFAGIQQVATVTATTFTMTIAGLTAGAAIINTTSTVDRILRFSTAVQTSYVSEIVLTTSSTVILNFTVPPDATVNHYYQVYRSSIAEATGTTVLADLGADDEMQLVYEAYPTPAELSAGIITVEDITLDIFRGAFLYTNSISGEGLLQANDLPPLSKDIAIWRNYVFYSNTKTRYRLNLSLLGVSFLISEAQAGRIPKMVIGTSSSTNVYSFVLGLSQITTVTTVAGGALAASGTASYFLLYNAEDQIEYYVWYQIGTATDPAIAGKTGIMVVALAGDTAAQIATKTNNTLSTYINDFTTSVLTTTVTITNINVGTTTAGSAGTSGFTVTVTQTGTGENASAKQILLSQDSSAGQAVDITARSLVRVINRNSAEVVSAFYLSGPTDVPGKMLFEGKALDTPKFYVLADTLEAGTEQVGDSFSPILTPTNNITVITAANPSIITSTAHGLLTNDQIVVVNSNSTPSIDGVRTITRIDANTFSIPVNVTIAGTRGAFTALKDTLNLVQADNEISPNRVYYSKVNQPEAVPILNYIDLGPKDQAIRRLAPLRDSLLVFKDDGVYRISGNSAPFSNEVLDGNTKIVADDSLVLLNNLVFAWVDQGIATISESGSTTISRDIDVVILPKVNLTNFETITWGVGYDTDNTYRVYTVKEEGDSVAEVAFQYHLLTGTWSTLTNSATCGIVNTFDEKLYLGAGDINSTEQERKDFSRLDYAGREYGLIMPPAAYLNAGLSLRFTNAENIEPGDVIVQDQYLTVYEYNQLLKKLDLDVGINDPTFLSTLEIAPGDDLRTAIEDLAVKLDAEPLSQSDFVTSIEEKTSTITNISVASNTIITTSAPHGLLTGRVVLITSSNSTPSINGEYAVTVLSSTTFSIPKIVTIAGTTGSTITILDDFRDVSTCYNKIITKLNADTVVQFINYDENETNTIQECIVSSVNYITNTVVVNIALPYVQGDLKVFKAIQRTVTYSPIVFGDPLSWKHIRQATMLFENKNFTRAVLAFATDLLPAFNSTAFTGLGNGIFGHSEFGEGFFGGLANSTPFRTYVPRNCARCRFLVVKFTHKIAREGFGIFGLTLTGKTDVSDRAYRV